MKAQLITPNLWFDRNAEEAVEFYLSVFKNSKKGRVSYYGKEGKEHHGMPEGTILTIEFWLNDQKFLALNGGPHFKFTEAISFIVNCKDQDEIDYYWNKLTEGGDAKAQMCGWLKDKFGLSWQIVPEQIDDMMAEGGEKADKVLKELLTMKKLDLARLQKAYNS